MINFKYTPRDYVSNFSLERLENTANTLEQGHKEAIKTQNELYATINSLDMHESESAYKAQLFNNIESIVQNEIDNNYGNAYSSLDKLIGEHSNLLKNQEITAKIKANQDYKNYEKMVKSSNVSEDRKNYILAHNTYEAGAYDENGNFKVNEGWKPQVTLYDEPDWNALLKQASDMVSEDKGQYTRTRWIDANGNLTTNWKDAVVAEHFDVTSGSWQKKSKSDILKQFFNLVNNNQELKASLQQSYDVAQWLYNTHKTDKNFDESRFKKDFTKENALTFDSAEEYFKYKLDPIAAEMEYNYSNSSVSYGQGAKQYNALMNSISPYYGGAQSSGKGKNKIPGFALGLEDAPIGYGNPVNYDLDKSEQNYNDAKRKFEALYKGNYNINGSEKQFNGIDDIEKRNRIINAFRDYKQANNVRMSYLDFAENEDERNILQYGLELENGGNFNYNNPVYKKAIAGYNNMFANGEDYIRITPNFKQIGNINSLTAGSINNIPINDINKNHLFLEEAKKLAPNAFDIITDKNGKNKTLVIHKGHVNQVLGLIKAANGNVNITVSKGANGKQKNVSLNKTIKQFNEEYNSITHKITKKIPTNSVQSLELLGASSFEELQHNVNYNNGMIDRTTHNDYVKDAADRVYTGLQTRDLNNYNIFYVPHEGNEDDSPNVMNLVTGEDKLKILSNIQNAEQKDISTSAARLPGRSTGLVVSVNSIDEDVNSGGKYYIENFEPDYEKRYADNDYIKFDDALVTQNVIRGSIDITPYNSNESIIIDALGDGQYQVKIGNKNSGIIPKDYATNVAVILNDYRELIENISAAKQLNKKLSETDYTIIANKANTAQTALQEIGINYPCIAKANELINK